MSSDLIRKFTNLARKERLTYMDLAHVFKQVRRNLGLSLNDRQFLFESSRGTKYTPRRIQQLVSCYMKTAGIDADSSRRLGPHILRHQFLTYLTRKGLTDAQIQLISGHSTKKSLEVYQHLSLKDVEKEYQEAWR